MVEFFLVEDDIKVLRETLCRAQQAISSSYFDRYRADEHISRLERLIQECDRHRPLGLDGKHGNLHTETCGCEDKGPQWTWGTSRKVS